MHANRRPRISLKRLVTIVALGLSFCVAVGSVYNLLANRYLQHLYPAPGKLYAVHGYRMHLYCTGAGTPTIVFDSGLGDNWLVWQKVQPELSKLTRVCSYDRAGLGWSDPQPGPRGALTISEQLHALLQEAGVTGPLLLVGHSAGGLYVRAFAAKYPAEVIGLALVDTSSPEAFHAFPNRKERDSLRNARHRKAMWLWLKDITGLQRLSGDCNGTTPKGLETYAALARTAACRPAFVNSWLAEWDDFESSAEDVGNLPCCGNMPTLVISRDPHLGGADSAAKSAATWDSVQEDLKSLSTRSRRIIARKSGHYVMIDRPDVVTSNVRRLILEVRSELQHSEYGSTVVQ